MGRKNNYENTKVRKPEKETTIFFNLVNEFDWEY